jgi:hypothetical protein
MEVSTVISKKQLCKIILDNFEKTEKRKPTEADITGSSSLAVAMEFLGQLENPMYKQYASERGGMLYMYIDEEKRGVSMLSVRELLGLLPDEVELITE